MWRIIIALTGIFLLSLGVSQIFPHVLHYSQLSQYYKGYVIGSAILCSIGIGLLAIAIKKHRRPKSQ